MSYTKLACLASLLYITALCIRGVGRMLNPRYSEFIAVFRSAVLEPDESKLDKLMLYSFSSSWPALFDVRRLPLTVQHRQHVAVPRSSVGICSFLWPLTVVFARTIGIRMAYPGATGILNMLTLPARLEARDRLRALYSVKRMGLLTREGEFVEGFYLDRRSTSTTHGDSNGNILIVCCEGNGGYPEIGISVVPLDLGYSVLAWNHPGFGSSTGMPFPKQEHNAMEAVLLFAIHHLKFKSSEIYLYGWSIGGYTASWAAMNFPSVGGLILDATFDNLDELARRTVPDLLYPFVLMTLKQHLDLDNVPQLQSYDGPIRIIRRAEDEIITTSEPPSRGTNRGNFLLIKLLKYRFPNLLIPENEALLKHYLALSAEEQDTFVQEGGYHPEEHELYIANFLGKESCRVQLEDNTECNATESPFPSHIGSQVSDPLIKFSMLLFIVSRYFSEAPGSHCAPLPSSCFQLPWSPSNILSSKNS